MPRPPVADRSPRRLAAASLLGVMALACTVAVLPASAATTNVTVGDNVFQPGQLTVTAGDSVVWTLTGAARPHTITADDGSFDSANLTNGQSFSRTFDTAGTIRYYCKIHGAPGGIGMSGTLVVQAAPVATTAAPTTTAPEVTTTTAAAQAAPATTTTAPAAVQAASTTRTTTPAAAGTGLAATGVPVGWMVLLGVVLLGGGAVVVRSTRRHSAGSR